MERRKAERRGEDRRKVERKTPDRRVADRRKAERREGDRRLGERRGEDRRKTNRNTSDRRVADRRKADRREADDKDDRKDENEYSDKVEGRNSVLELLKSDRDVNKIWVTRGEKHGSIHQIIKMAKEKKIVLVEVDKTKLDEMSETQNHQGVIALVPPFNYCEVEDILEYAKQKNEDPFIVLLDGIEDPHNLGSIIRTAETAGVHGIIIPKRRGVSVNSTVSKVSAGAVEHMKIARVTNLNQTIQMLKDNGIWIIGTDMEGTKNYYDQDFKGAICIVIGSEGFGMSRLVKENADLLVKIPMKGKITSLNASVSAGIVIYEALKHR